MTARAARLLASAALGLLVAPGAAALASRYPPAPTSWLVDRAALVSPAGRQTLDHRLEALERRTGVRLVIYIEPRLPADEALEDYTLRTLESWTVWHRDQPALVLFIFPESRRLRFEVGYGAEGSVTDLEARRILDEDLAPAFRAGEFEGGIARALDSLEAALAGELPPKPAKPKAGNDLFVAFLIVLVVFWFFILPLLSRRGRSRLRRGRGPDVWLGGGGWGGGGGPSGGGSVFGGGGDLASGGDLFGGGGAWGDW